MTLAFFASDSFQHVAGYMIEAYKYGVCSTLKRVCSPLVAKSDQLFTMPTNVEMRRMSNKLFQRFNVPNSHWVSMVCTLG